jgi:hypothetical protein
VMRATFCGEAFMRFHPLGYSSVSSMEGVPLLCFEASKKESPTL